MTQNFKERFGLDFLSKGPAPTTSSNDQSNQSGIPQGLEPMIDALGAKLLDLMRQAPNQTVSVLNLASLSSMRVEALIPVLQYLLNRRVIERVAESPIGDDLYHVLS